MKAMQRLRRLKKWLSILIDEERPKHCMGIDAHAEAVSRFIDTLTEDETRSILLLGINVMMNKL